jgi:eukaryotic-like serine/threonine-protein kinase
VTPERWHEVSRVYGAVAATPPAARPTALAKLCGGDEALQREVEELLAHASGAPLVDRAAGDRPSLLEMIQHVDVGSQIGAFRIESLLGVGGMGEVYRARDTKLNRDVAIKILPSAFTNDPDRLARFKREAQVLASLNHPNIGAIHGFEDSGGVHALVLELVDGPTLADRIARGPLPLDEALTIAQQIVDALECAHEQRIVHRDLKPANIKVREDGTVKVLDFGLAKLAEATAPAAAASLTQSPTITTPAMTAAGIILGTAAYMSPEQAKGRPADKRSDIWAFGCVLYEMLAGKRAFEGDGVSDTLAAVLRGEPDWSALPLDLAPLLRALLEGCLKKDRKQRIADISTAWFLLARPDTIAVVLPAVSAKPPSRRSTWRRRAVLALGTLVIAAGAAIVAWDLKPLPTPLVARIAITLPSDQVITNPGRRVVAVSPDGATIVYVANNRLYRRALADRDAKPIPGTENVTGGVGFPTFSPDGQSLAYYAPDAAGAALKRIGAAGGTPQTICLANGTPNSLIWDIAGITFTETGRGILRVAARGGTPEVIVATAPAEIPIGGQLLPDGEHVLFAVARTEGLASFATLERWGRAPLVVQSIRTGERKVLLEGAADPRYIATGHIVYAVGGVMFAVPFDTRRLTITGTPTPVLEGVARIGNAVPFDVSPRGTLVYMPGSAAISGAQTDLALIGENASVVPLKLPAAAYQEPRISPDGKRIAFTSGDGREVAVWIYELSGTTAPRRLAGAGHNRFPIWSADGERVAFQSDRDGDAAIFWQRADGVGTAERLTKPSSGESHVPESWMPNGDRFLFDAVRDGLHRSLVFSTTSRRAEPFDGVQSINPINAVFSPDGKWVAYTTRDRQTASVQLTLSTIYVQPFPPTGTVYQLTRSDNGHFPVWSRDGKTLFYIPGPGRFASIAVNMQPTVTFSNPTGVSSIGFLEGGPAYVRSYDLAPDSKHVLGVVPVSQTTDAARVPNIEVVVNWLEELKARAAAR